MSKLIYVDKLKKDILDLPNCYNGFSDAYDKSCIIGVIDEQPTVEERKTGRWIGYNTEQDGWKRTDGSPVFMSCSECNGLVLNNGSAHWNYCPNCGARMEGT